MAATSSESEKKELSGSQILVKAAYLAAVAHKNQKRKSDESPYINHPLGVAAILAGVGIDDVSTLAAAMLHDVVEDTDVTIEQVLDTFGEKIASIVAEVTDDKSLSKVERKRGQIAHAPYLSKEAKLVKLADKLYNFRDLQRMPPKGWDANRVIGYFAWGLTIVRSIKDVSPKLWKMHCDVQKEGITIDGIHLDLFGKSICGTGDYDEGFFTGMLKGAIIPYLISMETCED